MPVPPSPSSPTPMRGKSCLMVGVLILMLLLLLVVFAASPQFAIAFLCGGLLLFGMIGLHYFVWGRRIGEMMARELPEDRDYPDTPAGSK